MHPLALSLPLVLVAAVPAQTSIDEFVRHDLEAAGLTPAPAASDRVLVRRAYYDLTGLAPSPAEVEAFVTDAAADKWERLIDALLASPHYGEKWGRHWLDLVRYAETNGYERDSDKPFIWRYRDYVIDAFNADLPYDRFILEQLAGDELDTVTPQSITATGYYRLGVWDDEPGMGVLRARYDGLDDIVSTTGQAFLGMTLGCARCHDHKKDPIPQTDYYRFMAFFHGITDMSKEGFLSDIMSADERAEYDRAIAERDRELAEIDAAILAFQERFVEKLREHDASAEADVADLSDVRYRFYRSTWERLPDFDALRPEATGSLGEGLFDLQPATRQNAIGFVFEGRLTVPTDGDYTFELAAHGGARLTIDGSVVIDHDGLHRADETAANTLRLRRGRLPVRLDYFNKTGRARLQVRWSPAAANRWRPLTVVDARERRQQIPRLIDQRGAEVLPPTELEAWAELQRRRRETHDRRIPRKQAAAVQERGPTVADLHVHRRGNPEAPGTKVEPGFPTCLQGEAAAVPQPRPTASSSGRRRALAEWIADAANPRTARVLVNRLWHHHFGHGIVRTTNDFGGFGSGASHPALLDWLAEQFVARGWSIKAMHRLIMTSATYRQSSAITSVAWQRDPTNDLFGRFEMRRLTAEEMRDSVLQLTGRLNPEMHGPGVFVPMPKAQLATSSRPDEAWGTSPEDQTWRRSIYIKVKRSLLPPILANFDFADTDTSCPERFTTTLPTQALGMLNGDFANRHAGDFADRLRREAGDDADAQVRLALRLALCREPADEEVASHVQFLTAMREELGASAAEALRNFCLMTFSLNEFAHVE